MKKIVLLSFLLVFFLLVASFSLVLSTQYLIDEGEKTTITIGGTDYTVGVSGVSDSDTAVITVNDVSKSIDQGQTKKINGLYVYLDAVYYYPKEGEISQAIITVSNTLQINEGENITISFAVTFDGNYNIGVSGVSDADTAVITVNDVSKVIDEGQTKEIGGLDVYLVSIHYDPKEGEISSAKLDVSESTTTTTVERTCTDSDGGKNYYTYGTVKTKTEISSGTYYDLCWSGSDVLHEWYCDGWTVKKVEYECPNGCASGACKLSSINKTCTDSDGGLDYYTKGTVAVCTFSGTGGGCGVAVDYCNGDILTEGYCVGTDSKTVKYTCPYGCSDGACVKQTDDDWHYVIVHKDQEPGWYCINIAGQTRLKFEFKKVNPDYARCLWAVIDYDGPRISADKCAPESWGCYKVSGTLTPYNCWNFAGCTADGGKLYRLCSGSEGSFVIDLDEDAKVACAYATVWPEDCPGKNCWQARISETNEPPTPLPESLPTTKCKDYDNSPNYINNPPYNINPTNYPDLFTKSYGTGIYAGSSPDNHQIYGQEPNPSIAKPTTNDYSTYYDYCANDKQLNEAFCMADGILGAHGINCPNGCNNGACIQVATTIPTKLNIQITSPKNGQRVSGTVTVVAEASSTDELGQMNLGIQRKGENVARAIIFTNCRNSIACPVSGGDCVKFKSCSYEWDTTGYDGGVHLTAAITDSSNNNAGDSIEINVINYESCSNQCGLKGYRYGTCKTGCEVDEVNIGRDGCPQSCETCPAGQVCPPCPVNSCCCVGKRSCPYECCVNDPDYLDKSCPVTPCPLCKAGEECPPCIQPKCINHRCVWYPEEEFVLKLNAGWNMFSFPVDIRSYLTATSQTAIKEVTVEKAITGKLTEVGQVQPIEVTEIPSERRCPSPAHIWHYSNGRYIDVLKGPNSMVNGWGYWVKMDYDCIANTKGSKISIDDFPELNAGWNQIGAPSEAVNFYSAIGDCNLLSGPWLYNSASKKYQKAQVLKPGEGYFVKVKNKCSLGSEIPPLPPEDLGLGRAFRVG